MSLIEEKTLADHDINVRSIRQELQLLEEQLKKHGRNEIQPSLTATDPDTVRRQAARDAVFEELDSIDHVPQWVFDRLTKKIENLPPSPTPSRPHWIPCSERLPKEEDYRECMECLDGAVWYYTSRKTMGLGYYYYSTKQWSTICDMKPDGKVIAWMSLPEPYQEGEG